VNKYVLTDIHGCLKTFKHLVNRLRLSKDDKLYILGDLIDRGPNSKGVIDYIWKLQNDGYQIKCIKGNHDQMMLNALESMSRERDWLSNGGWTTVRSFQTKTLKDIPLEYYHFISKMPYFIEVDDFIIVHAGLNFKTEQPLEDSHAMMWIRNWYNEIDYKWLKNRIIVHGHTPISKEKTIEMFNNLPEQQFLNLDTGCVYKGKMKGLGVLTCLNLTTKELTFQENLDW